jgi:molybdate transport system substrate-binding protein
VKPTALLLAAGALLVAVTGCSSPGSEASGVAADASETTSINVFAASSLTNAFRAIGPDFEAANPGMTVTFNLGSSTDLAAQIATEGTADVFASASGAAMDAVAEDPGVVDRVNFTSNPLVIITPPDDPANISSIGDLTTSGVQLVVGATGVPVGDYAREVLEHAGISNAALANVVSNEPDDASIVEKIASGEADAGIVYTSDVAGGTNDVRSVTIPADVNVIATYPIAVIDTSERESQARAFVSYVAGPAGQATLRTFGFGRTTG